MKLKINMENSKKSFLLSILFFAFSIISFSLGIFNSENDFLFLLESIVNYPATIIFVFGFSGGISAAIVTSVVVFLSIWAIIFAICFLHTSLKTRLNNRE